MPVPAWQRTTPLASAKGLGALPLIQKTTGPTDRCIIPTPTIDEEFAKSAPQVDDRFFVASLVQGLPVSNRVR